MAAKKKCVFNDPQFNAYCHFIFLNLSKEEKRDFTEEELNKIRPGKNLVQFCTDGTLDEKVYMLSKAGVPSTVVCRQKDFKRSDLMEFYDQYKDQGVNQDLIGKLVDSKIFVLASAKIMQAYHFIHQQCQSDFYRFNRNFQKIYQLWNLVGEKLGTWRGDEDIKEVSKGADLLIEMTFKIMRNQSAFADLGLGKAIDLQIILYLLRKNKRNDNRTAFIDCRGIFNECTDGSWKEKSFYVRLSWLYQHKFIEKMGNKYSIADKGVQVGMEYVSRMAEYIKFEV